MSPSPPVDKPKSWLRSLDPLFRANAWHTAAPSPAEEAAYWESERLALLERGRSLVLLMAAINVVWWPTDLIFYRGEIQVSSAVLIMRTFGILVGVIGWTSLGTVNSARRHPVGVLTVGVTLVTLVCGYELGSLGGAGTLWYYFLPYVALGPVSVSLPLRKRVGVTFVFVAAMITGFFLLHTEHLRDRRAGAAISFTIAVGLFSVLSGVLADRLRRQNFFLRVATERQASEMQDLLVRVRELATTDALTSLRNVREFNEQLQLQCAQSERSGDPLSLIMLDLDRFKSINDRYGHDSGDAVLAHASKILRRCVRAADVPFRVGGEEFAVICPLADTPAAAGVADRIRTALAESPLELGGVLESLTASFGVTSFRSAEQPRDMYRRADQALYRAKQRGRNRVETESESTPPPSPAHP